ncbi:MAG: hypothetical protein RMK29_02060 [Myxococcales bacterium]|nr:hypothetical protein [Myxococcota bacterium]MDW8280466.1 hypothetical protein [Myxococcales bacterium]
MPPDDRKHDQDLRDAADLDEPEAPPNEEELRAAAALRDELERSGPPSAEVAWLRAHLRLPTWDDSLGEVRARGLARAAREQVQARRAAAALLAARLPPWRQVRRALIGTGGLVASATLLFLVSSAMLDQMRRPAGTTPHRAAQAELLRTSLRLRESPSRRLDLMLEDRLQLLRQSGYQGLGRTRALSSLSGPAAVLARAGGTP